MTDIGPGKPPRQPRRRIAKGPPRPEYLESPDLDRLMIMFVALVSEHLALRDRVHTHELLLERDKALTPAAIEAFRPSAEVEDEREQGRMALMRRVFRVLRDDFEHLDQELVKAAPPPSA